MLKWTLVAFFLFVASLFFREQHVPGGLVVWLFARVAPTNLVLRVDSASFGFRDGVGVRGVRLYDSAMADPTRILAGAESIRLDPFRRRLRVVGALYTRLPDSYYAPGNMERNARVEGEFPELGTYAVELERPDILAVRPARVACSVAVGRRRVDVRDIHLVWPEEEGWAMSVDGFCAVDLDRQLVEGEVQGCARQAHIRPLLVALDVPVALPYMDGFTEVPEPCPSWCAWKVDLVRNDLDLWLDLRPVLGRYNGVPMASAEGRIHLHNYTRGTNLNYRTVVGPIAARDVKGRALSGTVTVTGVDGTNVVTVVASSAQPVADVLRIGGFTGDYVGPGVIGESSCRLEFRFPRAMTNNYQLLNGKGHVEVQNGQLMRMRGFKGLIELMPSIASAVTWFSDTTQASCDYVIENGVVKTDNVYIEGTLFSIRMAGWFDAAKGEQDFQVLVQFTKKDSLVGKVIHPLTWPFSKLLLEFRLSGTPEEPKWAYVSVIDRVLEVVK